MERDLIVRSFVIIKGFIDARDERGKAIFGTLLSLVSRREIKYLSVMFSHEETPKSITWNDLLLLHKEKASERDRYPMMIHQEEEFFKFLRQGTVLNNVAKNHNTKQAEQSISRYCLDSLQLKAVSFIEFSEALEGDMEVFALEEGHTDDSPEVEAETPPDSSDSEDQEEEKPTEPKAKEDVAVRCEPILAPVGGVAMNELSIGDTVMVSLPADSVFYKLLSRNVRGFDGVISANVTGLLQNELGTATVSLSLAEGINGVMKLSGKVRIKKVTPNKEKDVSTGGELWINFVFGIAGAIIVFAALAVLYYLFG